MVQEMAEPYVRFREFIRRHNLPLRSAYSWKDQGLFDYTQIGQVILVKEIGGACRLGEISKDRQVATLLRGGKTTSATC
jgi:hypothetical protein